MKTVEIFEPAMCCSTGLCGPGVDRELLRISGLISALAKQGITIGRYNLSADPQAFVSNAEVNKQLTLDGPDILPLTLVDGEIVKTGGYPSDEELHNWLGLSPDKVKVEDTPDSSEDEGCCSDQKSCDISCGPEYEAKSGGSGCC